MAENILQNHVITWSSSSRFYSAISREKMATICSSEYDSLDELNKAVRNAEEIFCKIIPIFNESWDVSKNHPNIGYTLKYVQRKERYKMETYNEVPITQLTSKASELMITPNFVKCHKEVVTTTRIEKQKRVTVDNQYFVHLFLNKESNRPPDISLFENNINLVYFSLMHCLAISWKLFNFTHGDILRGRDNNMLYTIKESPGITHVVFTINSKYYAFKLSEEGRIPTVLLFDYGYSNIDFNGTKITNRVPNLDDRKPVIGDSETFDLRNSSDINDILKINMDHEGVISALDRFDVRLNNNFETMKASNNGIDLNIADNRERMFSCLDEIADPMSKQEFDKYVEENKLENKFILYGETEERVTELKKTNLLSFGDCSAM